MSDRTRTRRTGKRYDEAYFEHWYRDEDFGSPVRLDRKVAYALSVCEYLLDRPVRSVLDIGCGEGPWHDALAELRPRATYLGIDPSEYAVERFGEARNLRLGGVDDLGAFVDEGPFDLAVCVDVLGYVEAPDVRAGFAALAEVLDGVALIEVFTKGDDWEGDFDGFHDRPAATYERWFTEAGLSRIGPNLVAGPQLLPRLAALERR